MKKIFGIFAIAALLMVIFSSGCTIPGLGIEIPGIPDIFGGGVNVQEQRSDVISIEQLDAIPSTTVRSGQSIRLRAVVKDLQKPEYNPVNNVEIGLYNTCDMFDVSGEFCSNSEQGKPGWDDQNTKNFNYCKVKMYPQSSVLVEWKLTAKEINVETPCKIGIMARYNYTTFSTASVTFVNKAELERIVSEGKSISETGTLSIGEGPVKPHIEVLNQPIVIDVSANSANTVRDKGSGIMSFWIENNGGGIIDLASASSAAGNVLFDCTKRSLDAKGPQQICLKITGSVASTSSDENIKAIMKDGANDVEKTLQECMQKHLQKSDASNNVWSINFIGTATPKYSCSITLGKTETLKQETTYQITAQVDYFYKFTKELSITVQPRIKL
jgi:hypothetical protein